MAKIIKAIRGAVEDFFRGLCGRINPDKRVYVIVSLLVIFAVLNIIFVSKAIYNIGRERDESGAVEITPIEVPNFNLQYNEPDSLQKGFEAFFEQNFNQDIDDTTDK